jgi:hypothetical protein
MKSYVPVLLILLSISVLSLWALLVTGIDRLLPQDTLSTLPGQLLPRNNPTNRASRNTVVVGMLFGGILSVVAFKMT